MIGILLGKFDSRAPNKKIILQSITPQVTVLPSAISPTLGSDLSYIEVVADPSISFRLLSKDGSVLAESFAQQSVGNSLLFSKPATGDYQLVVVNNSGKSAKLDFYFYDRLANAAIENRVIQKNTSMDIYFDKINSRNSRIKDN